MPVNFTAPEGATLPKTDGSMFAPTPLWDRAPKKRRRGASAAARQPRNDPAMDAGEPGAGAGVLGATTAAEPLDPVYETQPPVLAHSNRTGMVAGAIAVGVVVVAALGGVGWYASQSRAPGVAELTPGAPATSQVALNTAAPPVNPMPAASSPAPVPAPVNDSASTSQDSSASGVHGVIPAAPRHTAKSVATRTPTPRVRPADNSSALSSGVDASTTSPMINTPAPAPSASPMQAAPVNPVVPAPAPATPSTTSPPAGSTDDSAAPTASAPVAPTATP